MVFESVISAIMNRFLGEFIENLDGQNLNLGIWSGMVNVHGLGQ